MQDQNQKISELFLKTYNILPDEITLLAQSGSDRKYYRVSNKNISVIATVSLNVKENETFFYFTQVFEQTAIPVPSIIAVSEDKTLYLQSDLGNENLLDLIIKFKNNDFIYQLLQKVLLNLINIQIDGNKNLDYNKCIGNNEFGKQTIFSDLLYFKYYFADTLKIEYNKQKLIDDFERISNELAESDCKYFMFRDFQSRNIMVKNAEIYFIDYQGGMKGAVQYDLASFLWQAKAQIPEEWKEKLLNFYIEKFEEKIKTSLNRTHFINQYYGYVLLRLLQVLGAYGFRGIFERKTHFLESIAPALQNLKSYLKNHIKYIENTELLSMLEKITNDEVVNKFITKKADINCKLTVKVNSFSYIKNGYPNDNSEHKGGFVFDCRGILNPGRIDEYKDLNGRHNPVIYFLEQKTKMPDFLNNIYGIVDISVAEYINRGFESLTINFGCTGGQHRSVYAADKLANHIFNKYNVKVELNHIIQNINQTFIPKTE